jgi:hypothetical protein
MQCVSEAGWTIYCCRGKVISITCSDDLLLALVINYEKRIRLAVFQENPSSCNRVDACGPTDGQDKRIIAFRGFANLAKTCP